jgi:probable phosphomutase (TIGR03848 family)
MSPVIDSLPGRRPTIADVAVVLMVRHGRSTANSSGLLAGWTPGIELDEAGQQQASALAERTAGVRLDRVVVSPLERCRQTAQPVLDRHGLTGVVEPRLGEARYGDWTNRPLKDLARTRLWRVVQDHPSAAVFPGPDGESMAALQARAVAAVRDHDREVQDAAGDAGVWMAVSHGDVIKAVLADALGMHLDLFQRIVVDPGSVSIIRYTERRPFVLRTNDTAGSLEWLRARRRPRARRGDAAVGGGAGDS